MSDVTNSAWIRLNRMWAEMEAEQNGSANQVHWRCGDGWIVGYTTERVTGGPHDGKFVAMAFKPYGKGARTDPQQWKRVYTRAFAKRKTARARAEAMYDQHALRNDEAPGG
jgi:hypothetical protein